MTRRTAKRSSMPEPDGPAIVTRDFVMRRDRMTGRKTHYERVSTLARAKDKGQLAGGPGPYTEDMRLAAGNRYCEIFDRAQASGRDSTQALMTTGGGAGTGLPLTQVRADAMRLLVAVDSHMGARDRQIARKGCCQGYTPSEAVRQVLGPDFTKAVSPRFREALDALIEAFRTVDRDRDNAFR